MDQRGREVKGGRGWVLHVYAIFADSSHDLRRIDFGQVIMLYTHTHTHERGANWKAAGHNYGGQEGFQFHLASFG